MQRKEKRAVRPGSRAVCYTTLQHGSSLPVAGKTELCLPTETRNALGRKDSLVILETTLIRTFITAVTTSEEHSVLSADQPEPQNVQTSRPCTAEVADFQHAFGCHARARRPVDSGTWIPRTSASLCLSPSSRSQQATNGLEGSSNEQAQGHPSSLSIWGSGQRYMHIVLPSLLSPS